MTSSQLKSISEHRPVTVEIDSDDDNFDGTVNWDISAQQDKGKQDTYKEDSCEEEYSEDDDYDDAYTEMRRPGPNQQSFNINAKIAQNGKGKAGKLMSRINTNALPFSDELSGSKLGHSVKNAITLGQKKADAHRNRGLMQDTRATVEQVLDPRTCLLLVKFMRRGVFTEIYGCLSTGKEANVYYAINEKERTAAEERGGTGGELAVKVFKTSILVFKDRSKYVEGEFRFRHGYGGRNPRKMVAQWAEKEFRNLKRIQSSGIRAPLPLELRGHVLVMRFLGDSGVAGPRLKDSSLSQHEWRRAYIETVAIMRFLFHNCNLVHGDLSEYNLLWHGGHVYVIDVSQSTEHDHPHSLDFLKRDCVNVSSFFKKVFQHTDPSSSSSHDNTSSYSPTQEPCSHNTNISINASTFMPLSIRELFDIIFNPKLPENLASKISEFSNSDISYSKQFVDTQTIKQTFWTRKDVEFQVSSNTVLNQKFLSDAVQTENQHIPKKNKKNKKVEEKKEVVEDGKENEVLGIQEEKKEILNGMERFDVFCKCLLEYILEIQRTKEKDDDEKREKKKLKKESEDKEIENEWKQSYIEKIGEGETEGDSKIENNQQIKITAEIDEMGGGGLNKGGRVNVLRELLQREKDREKKDEGEKEEESEEEEDVSDVEESIFLKTFIPSSLNEVSDFMTLEKEMERIQEGKEIMYQKFLSGVKKDGDEEEEEEDVAEKRRSKKKKWNKKKGGRRERERQYEDEEEEEEGEEKEEKEEDEEEEEEEDNDEEEDDDDESDDKYDGRIPEGMSAKEWKKKVKEENREKRKSKVPKHLKKKFRKQAANR